MQLSEDNFAGLSFESPNMGLLTFTRELGSGSYGTVWEAASPNSNHALAVKILFKANLTAKQLAIQSLEHKLHSVVSSHPAIISLLDVYEDDLHVYLIMDKWNGGDLFDALVDGLSFGSVHESLSIFLQIVDAIKYCHQHNIYHRDLKPENILLSRSSSSDRSAPQSIGISDFGLATQAEWSSEHGCGSIRYMSPECLDQDSLIGYSTVANDIWSLGVIFINIMANKNPWCEPSLDDAMYSEFLDSFTDGNIHLSPFFVKHFDVSPAIDAILKGCFNPDSSARWDITTLHKAVSAILTKDNTEPPRVARSTTAKERTMSTISWGSEEFESEMDFSTVPIFEDHCAPLVDECTAPVKSAVPKKKKTRRHRKKVVPLSQLPVSIAPPPPVSSVTPSAAGDEILRMMTLVFNKFFDPHEIAEDASDGYQKKESPRMNLAHGFRIGFFAVFV